MANTTVYDKKEYFEAEVREKLTELFYLLTSEQIPFYFTACVKNDESSSEYINEGALTGANKINLTDDQIKKHLLVGAGFDVIPKRDDLEIMMDDPDAL